jgi:hypothetical protein
MIGIAEGSTAASPMGAFSMGSGSGGVPRTQYESRSNALVNPGTTMAPAPAGMVGEIPQALFAPKPKFLRQKQLKLCWAVEFSVNQSPPYCLHSELQTESGLYARAAHVSMSRIQEICQAK